MKRVKCPGCKRLMAQLAPRNRDLLGQSWHYHCLANEVSKQLRHKTTPALMS
jgi:hypothetical protein